ncbi:uncharacterized protein AC631_00351 [Debaryomyces fabryi]|uniref:Oligopeptide transporter n=1 Tax=Debaryomyces fabryi TaxID=58627 RepID=A0A0V1Q5Y1_9ASCO|nr:uncharacterized protein AC631_00351 [Debaryomyces fabryi]KSA03896.1 hypothetical protein AC631_00351 [Debaryomyces fabryi]CUM48773.1 unnamed protein product [Debaryomyces fabryi]
MLEDTGENFDHTGQDEFEDNRMIPWSKKVNLPQTTYRATLVGLFIGSIVLISNFQFGLQTGWVSMMSLPSALLGFAIFKMSPYSRTFTDTENVFVQSVAVAVGTGPLAYGLIGIIPAIEKFLTEEESGLGIKLQLSLSQLMIWSTGLALFGVFFAVPLRKQVIINEKLPFPSGSATATLISVLHGTEVYNEDKILMENEAIDNSKQVDAPEALVNSSGNIMNTVTTSDELKKLIDEESYKSNVNSLLYTFSVSAIYTLLTYFVPILRNLPIFGSYLSKNYKWNFQPSPAYIGQGIIMGLPTVSYMLFGAILGWAILAPLAKYKGWAPGEIDNWVSGGQGWILWISLSVMISDSVVSFMVVTCKSLSSGISSAREFNRRRNLHYEGNVEMQQSLLENEQSELESYETGSDDYMSESRISPLNIPEEIDVDPQHLVSSKITLLGIIISSVVCIVAVRLVFGSIIPYYATIVAIILALFLSVMGVRALGETDLNPVSGIGKLSQLLFALIIPSDHPSKILINLVAGGIAEAGAQQAGDLMQDLKTGHLIGASPKAQFIAQLIGTVYSVFLSSVMYKVYNKVYQIPSDLFRVPTAVIWIDCSRLVTGDGLPPKAFEFSIFFGLIFAVISLAKNIMPSTSKLYKYLVYLPNGVAVGIGIYNTPNFTIARFIGGVLAYWWINHKPQSQSGSDNKIGMIIFSSGLVLGEGLLSGFTMILTSLGVHHF